MTRFTQCVDTPTKRSNKKYKKSLIKQHYLFTVGVTSTKLSSWLIVVLRLKVPYVTIGKCNIHIKVSLTHDTNNRHLTTPSAVFRSHALLMFATTFGPPGTRKTMGIRILGFAFQTSTVLF